MSKPSELPILFSAPMVRAVRSGAKTQTRRLMKPQPADDIRPHQFPNPSYQGWISSLRHKHGSQTAHICPYGKSGDRLWIRETCRATEWQDGVDGVCYLADDHWRPIEDTSESAGNWLDLFHYRKKRGAVVPAIHMPRWASRITLEITDVRVERVQDISDADAVREGVDEIALEHPDLSPRDLFQHLWSHINGADSWKENPWLWVIEFRNLSDELARAA